jgi:hypothetical protein
MVSAIVFLLIVFIYGPVCTDALTTFLITAFLTTSNSWTNERIWRNSFLSRNKKLTPSLAEPLPAFNSLHEGTVCAHCATRATSINKLKKRFRSDKETARLCQQKCWCSGRGIQADMVKSRSRVFHLNLSADDGHFKTIAGMLRRGGERTDRVQAVSQIRFRCFRRLWNLSGLGKPVNLILPFILNL